MTKERLKELMPVMQAWLDGKSIEYFNCTESKWKDVFNNQPSWHPIEKYRIKPEPKLRPWRAEEVPVVMAIKHKQTKTIYYPLSICDGHIEVSATPICNEGIDRSLTKFENVDRLCRYYDYTVDGGKTWLPCGVME